MPSDLRHKLHITALELTALGIGIITWAEDVSGHHLPCARRLSDSPKPHEKRRTEPRLGGMLIMQRLLEYHLLRPYFDVEHVFGPANIMADAACGQFKLIARWLCI